MGIKKIIEKIDPLKLEKILFISSAILNFSALLITLTLFEKGAVEGNPIARYFLSSEPGRIAYLMIVLFVWMFLGLLYLKIADEITDNALIPVFILLAFFIFILIDFLNDFLWLLRAYTII